MTTTSPAVALARAEWTKWTSIRQTATYGGSAVGLSVLITALLAMAMQHAHATCAAPEATCSKPPIVAPESVVTAGLLGDGTPGAGLIALMLLGAATILVEYRFGTMGSTFLVAPRRSMVVGVKAALTFVVAWVLAAVAAVTSGVVFDLLGGGAARDINPWSASILAMSVKGALVVAVASVGGVALAALLRNAIAVVTLVVMWPLVLEPLLPSFVPGSGETVAGLLPFVNARYFVGLGDAGAAIPWGPGPAGAYFTAWMAALLFAGILVTRRTTVR
ncbi:hypothetical protein ACOCJ5_07285 [Knoellia sp. CPCC 206450]|uniref:hypothetical protein n=1 Tax=Knoellia tibetensis TaxID=3404798 RepID=UPI003B43BBE8